MYNQPDQYNQFNNTNNKPKMPKKKVIELVLILVGILWGILFAINYVRYTKSEPLLLSIKSHHDYADGFVDEYVSLGYVYRSYNRIAISREELVPFWVLRENPAAENDLPIINKDYKVPDNGRHEDKYMGILYFYSTQNADLLGTYKCINSVSDCEKATTGRDKFDIVNTDPITKRAPYKFAPLYNKYAFIDDSSKQQTKYGETGYARTIYLYSYEKNKEKILARYGDIKETQYNDLKELANYDKYDYIVKEYNGDKWGVIRITESGVITELLPFEYDSINYDYDTNYYILSKDGVWFAYDLIQNKKVSVDSVDVIYDIWKNVNNTYYFKTGRERIIGKESFMEYTVYRFDGTEFLKAERITEVVPRRTYLMYVTATDNKLHFLLYSKQEKATVQLKFSKLDFDQYSHPAFEIYTENDFSMSLKIYQGRDLKYPYEIQTVFTQNWELNNED